MKDYEAEVIEVYPTAYVYFNTRYGGYYVTDSTGTHLGWGRTKKLAWQDAYRWMR
jgi:hypothetical protein